MSCYTLLAIIVSSRGRFPSASKSPGCRAGALICCSVLAGQQQGRDRSVSLSNDPYCPSLAHAIAAQQSEALFETQFVFSLVVLAELTPIAAKMAREELQWRSVRLFQ